MAIDNSGIIYLADYVSHLIRKISPPAGGWNVWNATTNPATISIFAGDGQPGWRDGVGTNASFNYPKGITIDSNGNLFVTDTNNNVIRRVNISTAEVNTIAGNPPTTAPESRDGTGSGAYFDSPGGITIDSNGNLFVADSGNSKIRLITPPTGYTWSSNQSVIISNSGGGVVTTLAGGSSYGYADGTGSQALFYNPPGLALDSGGNLIVADYNNSKIRIVRPASGYTWNSPESSITYTGLSRTPVIGTGSRVYTIAGSTGGVSDGTGTSAKFSQPSGVVVNSIDNIFVADTFNNSIRMITPPAGLTWSSTGSVITSGSGGGIVTTVAGSMSGDSSNNDGIGLSARFINPYGIAIHTNSYMFVSTNARLRIITIG